MTELRDEKSRTEAEREWAHRMFAALPGYPWLPCPICGYTEGCDDTVRERALAALPWLILPGSSDTPASPR